MARAGVEESRRCPYHLNRPLLSPTKSAFAVLLTRSVILSGGPRVFGEGRSRRIPTLPVPPQPPAPFSHEVRLCRALNAERHSERRPSRLWRGPQSKNPDAARTTSTARSFLPRNPPLPLLLTRSVILSGSPRVFGEGWSRRIPTLPAPCTTAGPFLPRSPPLPLLLTRSVILSGGPRVFGEGRSRRIPTLPVPPQPPEPFSHEIRLCRCS